jgi:hypothetical protein
MPWIILVMGLCVLAGWSFEISVLKSIYPGAVTMKPSTAMCFVLSGLILFFMKKPHRHTIELGSSITALMFGVATMVISDFQTKYTVLFGPDDSPFTTSPFVPSVGTMIAFGLIVVVGIQALYDVRSVFIPMFISTIGTVATFGHLFNLPYAFYAIPEVSTGMAIHTALAFVAIGFSLITRVERDKVKRLEA